MEIVSRWFTYLSDFFLIFPNIFQKTSTAMALKVKIPRLRSMSTMGSGTFSVIFPMTHLIPPPNPSALHPPPLDEEGEVVLADVADCTLNEPRTSLAAKREVRLEGQEKLKFPTIASYIWRRERQRGEIERVAYS